MKSMNNHERPRMKSTPALLLITALVAISPVRPGTAKDASAAPGTQPGAAPGRPRIEVCFVLDTTGSMSGLIDGAKQKIWSIANELIGAKPTPELRLGLVAYRDRGDEYVTREFDLTNDIDAIYGQLQSFRADGGGDTPESVNEALNQAVRQMSWSRDSKVLKIIFLVGDSPPHTDYLGDTQYPDICREAAKRDLIINTVQCGSQGQTTPIWRQIAKLAEGSYAAIAQSGNMAVLATPMDDKLAELNRKLGETLVAYGSEGTRQALAAKQRAAEAAPAAVAADRLAFNASSGVVVQGEGELLDALNNGKLKFESLKKDQLPPEWQKLDAAQLRTEIDRKQNERAALQSQIQKLNQERNDYLAVERQRLAKEGKGDGFDESVAQTIRAQAGRKNIDYSK
jgi:Mg-chelatase subunit ChlD